MAEYIEVTTLGSSHREYLVIPDSAPFISEPRSLTDKEIDDICLSIVEHGVDGPEKPRCLPVPGAVLIWYEEL